MPCPALSCPIPSHSHSNLLTFPGIGKSKRKAMGIMVWYGMAWHHHFLQQGFVVVYHNKSINNSSTFLYSAPFPYVFFQWYCSDAQVNNMGQACMFKDLSHNDRRATALERMQGSLTTMQVCIFVQQCQCGIEKFQYYFCYEIFVFYHYF